MSKLEELESELRLVKNNNNEAARILMSMEAQIEALKTHAKQEEEWPKVGDEYWVLITGSEFVKTWCNDEQDFVRKDIGNVHRTKEQAEQYRDWLTNPRTQARRRIEMHRGPLISIPQDLDIIAAL